MPQAPASATVTDPDDADHAEVPPALVALTLHEYDAPAVSPGTATAATDPLGPFAETVVPPLDDTHCAVKYTLRSTIPVVVNDTDAVVPDVVIPAIVGVAGTIENGGDAVDGADCPALFVAVTTQV